MADPRFKLENQLCFPLYAAARKVTGLYTPYFHDLGITYTQYVVFMVLWEQDGLTIGELGSKLRLDSGTLTPLLKKMEEKGYVTRKRSTEDERIVRIYLTDNGRSVQDALLDVPEKVSCCIDLTPEEAATLYGLLYKILG
ncbi:MAG: MarR family transcriptional regulator [Firmicutes bacterium]|nr:MarR family transcriptional regulator [Bacillota bacterium]